MVRRPSRRVNCPAPAAPTPDAWAAPTPDGRHVQQLLYRIACVLCPRPANRRPAR
jgi:hypothetical protein